MKLDYIIPLYKSMKQQDISHQKFDVKSGSVQFECLFFVDVEPYELTLIPLGQPEKPFYFNIKPGFNINTYLGDDLLRFQKICNFNRKSGKKFSPNEFFDNIQKQFPQKASSNQKPTNQEIIQYDRKITEHRDRPYFMTTRQNIVGNQSEENYIKTSRLLSKRFADDCKKEIFLPYGLIMPI